MTNAISMIGLTKHYKDVQALTDLTLDVPAGTVFGFLGPNGAGKTTAMKVLAGLARATGGAATVNGVPVSAAGAHRRAARVPRPGPPFLRLDDRSRDAPLRGSLPWRRRRPRAAGSRSLLERVGLADAGDRRTATYSGGMRQRLGIAQALVGRPAVILLDEPVSALDPIGRKAVLELMQALKGETTVFYSTHILDDVQRVSDHVAILDHGRLVKAAPTTGTSWVVHQEHAPGRPRRSVAPRRRARFGSSPGVATVAIASRDGDDCGRTTSPPSDGASAEVQRAITGFAVDAGLTLISNSEETLDLETGLPPPHRPEGGGGMTAQSVALEPTSARPSRGGLLLGFGTVFRKEITDWLRGRRALVVGVVSILSVVFTTLVPFVVRATGQASSGRSPCRWIRRLTCSTAGAARPSRSSRCWRRWACCR